MVALFFVSGLNGLFLLVAVIRRKAAMRLPSTKLLLFVIALMSTALWLMALSLNQSLQSSVSHILLDAFLFLALPLLYLYLATLTGVRFRWWNRHLLPLAFFMLNALPYFFISTQHYHQLSSGTEALFGLKEYWQVLYSNLNTRFFELHWFLLGIMAVLTNLLYLIMMNRRLKVLLQGKTGARKSLRLIYWVSVLLLILWLNDFLPLLGLSKPIGMTTYGFWLALCLFIFTFSYLVITEPSFLTIQRDLSQEKRQERILEKQQESLEHLGEIVRKQQLYLDPELTLETLAAASELGKTDISLVLKHGFGGNFYDYINSHRLDHFIELAARDEQRKLTHLGMAMDSGFNTKTTFYKAFKKKFGMTPKAFFAKQVR